MYDTLIYGNGLTIAVTNTLWDIAKENYFTKYISFNNFIEDFIIMPVHKRLYRDFMRTFNSNTNSYEKVHVNDKRILEAHIDDIKKLGFERWVSSFIWDKDIMTDEEKADIKLFVYALSNYWYHILSKEILSQKPVKQKLQECAIKVKSNVNDSIFTLNFDTLLDEWLKPQHLHGRFVTPYESGKQLVLFEKDEDGFEYPFLYGSNGIEKNSRLSIINERKLKQDNPYDIDFFFGDMNNINYGHILLYGVSLGRSYILSDEFLENYPKNKSNYIIYSVDGHLLLKLDLLYKNKCIEKITISYYTEEDLAYYKSILANTDFKDIVYYKHTSEIFQF
ncbi:MAG: hypothetical protein JXN65_03065 [Clostridia bacterium]|nr:hypothetical protein [Clostridia bacterium]